MPYDVLCLRPQADFQRAGITAPATLAVNYRAVDDPQLAAHVRSVRALVIPAVGPKLAGSLFEGGGVKLVQVTGAGVDRLEEAAMKHFAIACFVSLFAAGLAQAAGPIKDPALEKVVRAVLQFREIVPNGLLLASSRCQAPASTSTHH